MEKTHNGGSDRAPENAAVDFNKLITDDYECMEDCRNCPFPGAKCYKTRYETYKKSLADENTEQRRR